MQFPFDVQHCKIQFELPDQLCVVEEHELGHQLNQKSKSAGVLFDEHFISCETNIQDKFFLPLTSSIFRDSINKTDKYEREKNAHDMLQRILSDVDIILNGCVQMIEHAHPNDEWTLTEILFSRKNFEFQTFLRKNEKYAIYMYPIDH